MANMPGEVIARLKSLGGFGPTIPDLASASDLPVPPSQAVFNVTGTTGIATINATGPFDPGRVLVLVGTDATGPAITDTAVGTTTQGGVHLSAAMTLGAGKTLTLQCTNTGSWIELARAVNG